MNSSKATSVLLPIAAFLLVAGCTRVRSISNTPPPGVTGHQEVRTRELSEFDVLGLEQRAPVSEEEIAAAVARAHHVALKPGGTILLIQSGATYPDGPMVAELSKQFRVVPFSGVVSDYGSAYYNTNISRSMRLAAARAGADAVVCYWGILESANEHLATKTVSWLPIVNWVLPDESLHMRIRVKVAMVDVKTGSWTMLTPDALQDTTWTTSPRRGANDRKQMESLKSKAYAAGSKELLKYCVN